MILQIKRLDTTNQHIVNKMKDNKTELRRKINNLITNSSIQTVEVLYNWLSSGKISPYKKVVNK